MSWRRLFIFVPLAMLVAPLGRQSSALAVNQPNNPSAVTHTIEFGGALGSLYQPAQLFIAPNDSVRWQGDFSFHPLVSDSGLWTTVSSGSEFTFTFNEPGVYSYHCSFHSISGMTGAITVGYRNFIPLVSK